MDGKLKHGNSDKLAVVKCEDEEGGTFYLLHEKGGTFERTAESRYGADMALNFARFADEKLPDPEGSDFCEYYTLAKNKYGWVVAVLVMRLYLEHWDEECEIAHVVGDWTRERRETLLEVMSLELPADGETA